MKKERVERLFAWLIHQVDNKYHQEVNMAMDCFLEETYTQEMCIRDRCKEEELKRRGGMKMNTPNAENNVEALSKYGRDLVEEVKNGKIDPIIGRDDEIRRVIQIRCV